jgi:conjugal transfer pilus assembly protein TraU
MDISAHSLRTRLLALVLAVLLICPPTAWAEHSNVCPDAKLWSGRLITDICWSCLFPIMMGGVPLGASADKAPSGRAKPTPPFMCICEDGPLGFSVGIPLGLWEPARLIEEVRLPYCCPTLGGIRMNLTRTRLLGGSSSKEGDDSSRMFYNFHYWSFPLLVILELFSGVKCQTDGYVDFDLMYLSEVDPTWSDDELAFYTVPEVVLFANPFMQAACIADAVAGLADKTIDSMFWCAGNWGGLYPFTGSVLQGEGRPRVTSLIAAKAIAALHRRGLAWKTMGDDALCKGYIYPTIPKEQYRLSMFFPVAETKSNHAIGATTFRWGEWRNIPGYEDYIYLVWRWKDCCLR